VHVAIIGTYPPTRCGIATFTADVETSLRDLGVDVTIVPVDPEEAVDGPSIDSGNAESYAAAATWLNRSSVDVVLVEHEFGIHGGVDGATLLRLTQCLTVPYVVTLHTVLPHFSASQAAVLEELCGRAAGVTVFTATARRLVLEQELAAAHSLRIVPHGAPVELYCATDPSTRDGGLGLPSHGPVLSTFGLLSSGKGLELTIRCLPALVAEWPDVRYVIAGRTHPGVVRHEGEQYRDSLHALADELGVAEHVTFLDRFLSVDEVARILAITDVFCTPYRNEDQIVSGALTFALAAGCPVASTPYLYATDMLSGGAGIIVPLDDVAGFAGALQTLLRDGEGRDAALAAAKHVSASLSWPSVARTLRGVLDEAMHEPASPETVTIDRFTVAAPARTHVRALCDDSAILQHAALRTPRLEEGYCVDDVARLLPLAARWAREPAEATYWDVTITRQLAFLRAAAAGGNGSMRNFMSWSRQWLDEPHDGDHVGRAVWGLGELIRDDSHVDEALDVLGVIARRAATTTSSHNLAYTALGLVAADSRESEMVESLCVVESALSCLRPDDDPTWRWPEEQLTYDSARLPEAMMRTGHSTNNRQLVDDGIILFRWLESLCTSRGHYRFPGHLGLRRGDDVRASGHEQPLEAVAMADAATALLLVTDDPSAHMMVERAWSWFNGNNRLGSRVGSVETGAGFDAICEFDVNRNCGAESTISFHRCAATWEDTLHRPRQKRRTMARGDTREAPARTRAFG
jgi:glycosyltransferase involved in cell wall biosynthesis